MTFEYEGPVATRALVVHAEFRGRGRNVKRDGRSAESRLEEALGLAQAEQIVGFEQAFDPRFQW